MHTSRSIARSECQRCLHTKVEDRTDWARGTCRLTGRNSSHCLLCCCHCAGSAMTRCAPALTDGSVTAVRTLVLQTCWLQQTTNTAATAFFVAGRAQDYVTKKCCCAFMYLRRKWQTNTNCSHSLVCCSQCIQCYDQMHVPPVSVPNWLCPNIVT